jgi:prophage DNA circulation protein
MDAAASSLSDDPHVLVIRGEEFTLPPGSLPWDASVELARFSKEQASPFQSEQAGAVVALDDALEIVFGAEQYQRVKALVQSPEEFMVVLNAITTLYAGANAGESRGSVGNSRSIGGPQKRTSNATTASTSAEPASDNGNA